GATMKSKSPPKSQSHRSGISRRSVLSTVAALPLLALPYIPAGWAQGADPLPSWNDGRTKQSILDFVVAVTRDGSPDFVPVSERIATFEFRTLDRGGNLSDGNVNAYYLADLKLRVSVARVSAMLFAFDDIYEGCPLSG